MVSTVKVHFFINPLTKGSDDITIQSVRDVDRSEDQPANAGYFKRSIFMMVYGIVLPC